MVALVSTDVTSPQSMPASMGPTSMGERRSRTLRRVPSTQATSPSVRDTNRCRSSARCAAACSVRVLRLARSESVGVAVVGEEAALCPRAPQRVDHAPAELGGPVEQLGQLAVVHRRTGVLVQDPRPDAVAQERTQLLADRRQGVEQVPRRVLRPGAAPR